MRWEENRYDIIQAKPTEFIVVEGFLLFHDEELLRELDLAIYIDIPDSVGLSRRLERENSEENREWFETVTFPEYAPRRPVFKSRAGLVLDGQQPLSSNYQIIRERIIKLHP
jgi:uridine kinase